MTTEKRFIACFDTTANTLNSVISLLERHPYLPTENLSYNRNFVSLLSDGARVLQELGEYGHSAELGECTRFGVRFSEQSDVDYDKTRISKLKTELGEYHNNLAKYSFVPRGLKQDFQTLKTSVSAQGRGTSKQIERLFRQLVILAPLIYNHDGEPLVSELNDDSFLRITEQAPADLENVYCDFLPQHLAPLLISLANIKGLGALHKITRYVLNQFVPKTVEPALKLYTSSGKVSAIRNITLEEVPPVYSPLRGALAGDCSMVSVPFHGLLKDNHTFWIRKSDDFDTKPDGYVIIALIEQGDKQIPYVITINGVTLTQTDCTAVCHLLAHQYNTDTIYTANLSVNAHYVNTRAISQAYESIMKTEETINLPVGWSTIDDNTISSYSNYYREQNASSVWQAEAGGFEQLERWLEFPSEVAYRSPGSLASLPVLSRAVLLHYFNRYAELEEQEEARRLCGLSQEQVEAIEPLIGLYRDRTISTQSFAELNEHFDFGLKELKKYDFHMVAPVLRGLYDGLFDRFPESEWIELILSVNTQLNEMISSATQPYDVYDSYKNIKASLPDIYIPNYWEELEPLLFLPNGLPDHHVFQQLVKHFHSVGTLEASLDHMLNYEDLLRSIDTEYDRWSDYFIRAKNLLEDQEKVSSAIDIAYLGFLRDTGKYHSEYNLAKSLFEYERIRGRQCKDIYDELLDLYLKDEEQLKSFDNYYHSFHNQAKENTLS